MSKILITGISGTVGTAFAELLSKDHEITGVDRNETGVARFKVRSPGIPAQVADFDEIIFAGQDLLIHLAAMKHVDLCEQNANACVLNNLVKTYHLFRNAHQNGVKILFMSTDKAVRPISVYGYTKALAEKMALEYGGAFARSGNVVASTGSVLRIWDEAIKAGQPLKVTHKDMRRYFITPENLVQRIWQQYLAGERVIVPEMDGELSLLSLLKEKLANHGYTEEDYPGGIEYTGLRPGEKLLEELQW